MIAFLSGEIVELSQEGVKSHCIVERPDAKLPAFCIFEYIYFSRPDSILEGMTEYYLYLSSQTKYHLDISLRGFSFLPSPI
jgi:glutamine phosphoribosylpyrophosphate amidotransferase